jgi:hypothetical protein
VKFAASVLVVSGRKSTPYQMTMWGFPLDEGAAAAAGAVVGAALVVDAVVAAGLGDAAGAPPPHAASATAPTTLAVPSKNDLRDWAKPGFIDDLLCAIPPG